MAMRSRAPMTPIGQQEPTVEIVGDLRARPNTRSITDRSQTVLMVLSDLATATISGLIGLVLVGAFSSVETNGLSNYWANVTHDAWFPVGVVTGLALSGSYRRTRRTASQSTFAEMNSYFFAIGAGGILSIAMASLVHHFAGTKQSNPTHILAAILVASILVPLGRSVLRHSTLRRHPVRVLICDTGDNVRRMVTHLDLQSGFQVLGWVPATEAHQGEGLGHFDELPELCARYEVDQVLVGAFDLPAPYVAEVLRVVQRDVQLSMVPSIFELVSWRSRFTELSGLPIIDTAPPNLSRWDQVVKRSFDIVVSLCSLALTGIVIIALAVAVKVTSRGPVLYRQTRLGRDRQAFTIYKFRTMRAEPEVPRRGADPAAERNQPLYASRHKLSEDARITSVGRFLRRTGLDELPQLFNVLLGQMSIVGPRPFVPVESDPMVGWQANRYAVRPGITGLWQVSGRNELSAEDLAQLDYLYVASWSMWWDLKIMWDTPRTMLRGIGAY